MSIDAAITRVSEIRSLLGTQSSAATATPAQNGAFAAQLAQQQASLAAMMGDTAEAGATSSNSLFANTNIPVLSVADQYQMIGIAPQMAGGFSVPGQGGPVGARIVQLAQQELGVSEHGSSNEAPRIREYRTATAGAENTPGPWCAYFVSWLAREAGAPIGANGNGTGYVPTLEAWGKQENRFIEHGAQTPAPGDVVIFNWGGQGVADHTGIVESVKPDGTIVTIEGNSSNAVKRRQYSASTNDISGYVRLG